MSVETKARFLLEMVCKSGEMKNSTTGSLQDSDRCAYISYPHSLMRSLFVLEKYIAFKTLFFLYIYQLLHSIFSV